VCAPCAAYEHGYDIDGWRVANFVRGAWFGGASSPAGFDHLGRIHRAWGVLDGEHVFAYDLANDRWLAVGAADSSPATPVPGTRLHRLAAALVPAPERLHPFDDGGIWGGP
jgi:hypothetical protein